MRLREILKLEVNRDDIRSFGPVLDTIEAYVHNPLSPKAGKLQALAKLDELLGLPKPADPEFALNVFLAIPDPQAVFADGSTLASHDDGVRFDPANVAEYLTRDVTMADLMAEEDDADDDEDLGDYDEDSADYSRW